MNRRRFFESLFKLGGTTIAAPIIAKTIDPTIFEKIGRWFKKLVTPISKVGNFSAFSFPLIRRIYPSLCAKEFISIQPMNVPSGETFYMDFLYQGKKVEYEGPTTPYVPDENEQYDWLDWKD